jgi:hypothetical protein
MKAYVITTVAVFGLLTVTHIWRLLAEGSHLAKDPFFIFITLASAALCTWGCRLLRPRSTRSEGRRQD